MTDAEMQEAPGGAPAGVASEGEAPRSSTLGGAAAPQNGAATEGGEEPAAPGHGGGPPYAPASQAQGHGPSSTPPAPGPGGQQETVAGAPAQATGPAAPQANEGASSGPVAPAAGGRGSTLPSQRGRGRGRGVRGRGGVISTARVSMSAPRRGGRAGRGGGRPSYDLVGNGFAKAVEEDIQEFAPDENEGGMTLVAGKRKGFACAYEGCNFIQWQKSIPTSRFMDHFAKRSRGQCKHIPAEDLEALNDLTGGIVQRVQDGQGSNNRSTVVLQPVQVQGSLHAAGQTQSPLGASGVAAVDGPSRPPLPSRALGSSGNAARHHGNNQQSDGDMLRFVDTMTDPQADAINAAITNSLLVAHSLSTLW